MTLNREFWGWDKPVLELAVEALARRAGTGTPPDLSRLLVVVPTRQAGRRLRERLAAWAAGRGTGVFPPHILQPNGLLRAAAGTLVSPVSSFKFQTLLPAASAEETLMALMDVLRGRKAAEFPHLLPTTAGEQETLDFRRALDIASKLCELRNILGEKGLSFAEVPELLAEKLEGDIERCEPDRWADLARIEELYLDRLADAGLADANAVRRVAAENPALPEGVEEVLVLAVPDPAPLAVDALMRLAERGMPVTICVHAPEELHEQFDDFGRPIAKLWLNRQVDVADDEIRLAGQPTDAAREVVEWIARTNSAPADSAIGVPDESIVPHLRRFCEDRDWTLFDPAGKRLAAHTAAHLALNLAELRVEGRFTVFSALLRHPDIQRYFRARLGNFDLEALLTAADTFQNAHLPETLHDCMSRGDDGRQKAEGKSEGGKNIEHRTSNTEHRTEDATDSPPARSATLGVKQNPWPCHSPDGFGEMRGGHSRERHLADSSTLFFAAAAEMARLAERTGEGLRGLAGVLQEIYAVRELVPGTEGGNDFAEAADGLMEALAVLDGPIAATACTDGRERLELLRRALSGVCYYADPEPVDAIEAQGWLELPWNDAPHLALTGFNEGFVPDSVVGHAFLPDAARAALGLPHNEQRFVRDIYLLTSMLAWRRVRGGRVLVTACKTDAEKEPLRPSRLLFLCEDSKLAARAERLFGRLPEVPPPAPRELAWKLAPRRKTPEKMSVTDFKAYLDCPVHYHLQRNLRMSPLDDHSQELDALAFGSLCHDVLKEFAEAPDAVRHSDQEEVIRQFVEERADELVQARYGARLPATLLFQRAALKQRLAHFARAQAAHRAEGWRIEHAEFAIEGFELDGMPVRGRIDRLDVHDDGRALVLDYKTSDTAEAPEKTHLKSLTAAKADEVAEFARCEVNGETFRWSDLQLPLYLLALESESRRQKTEGKRQKAEGRSEENGGVFSCSIEVAPRLQAGYKPLATGYFCLPKAVTETRVEMWQPEPEHLASAERCAKGIIAAVHAGAFWPPGGKWDLERDDLAAALIPSGFTVEECFEETALSAPKTGGAA